MWDKRLIQILWSRYDDFKYAIHVYFILGHKIPPSPTQIQNQNQINK